MRLAAVLAVQALVLGCKPGASGMPQASSTSVPDDQFVQLQNVKLHYLDWGGDGDLMLLVPGVTATAHVWNAVAPHFVDKYHVIAVTRRDHGDSEATARPFSLDDLADDLAEVIERFSDRPAIIVGHSYAGLEMPRLYQRHKDRVRALVFVDALFGAAWDGGGPAGAPGFGPPDSAYRTVTDAATYFRTMFAGVTPELASQYVGSQLYSDESGRYRWRIPVPSPLLTRFLSLKSTWSPADYVGIEVPVLVIRAAQARYIAGNLRARGFPQDSIDLGIKWARDVDDAQKIRTIDALLDAVPDAVSVVLDSTSHALVLDRPEVVVELIQDFLRSHVQK